jgi:hypothetical protein
MLKIDHIYIFYYECGYKFFNQTFGNVIYKFQHNITKSINFPSLP